VNTHRKLHVGHGTQQGEAVLARHFDVQEQGLWRMLRSARRASFAEAAMADHFHCGAVLGQHQPEVLPRVRLIIHDQYTGMAIGFALSKR
jgi:hypothetical protein